MELAGGATNGSAAGASSSECCAAAAQALAAQQQGVETEDPSAPAAAAAPSNAAAGAGAGAVEGAGSWSISSSHFSHLSIPEVLSLLHTSICMSRGFFIKTLLAAKSGELRIELNQAALRVAAAPAPAAASAAASTAAGGAAAEAVAPPAEDDSDELGFEMTLASGMLDPRAMATSGPLHQKLLTKLGTCYRRMYIKNKVPEGMIDGIVAQVTSQLATAPVISLKSAMDSVKGML